MKTHEAAKYLKSLAISLNLKELDQHSSLGNLEEIISLFMKSPNYNLADVRVMRKSDELAVSLLGLTALSKYSKQQWIKIIEEFSLPIDLNPRASTRDVVGKVLAYLEAHPEVLRQHIKAGDTADKRPSSTTLEDTLNKLIDYK